MSLIQQFLKSFRETNQMEPGLIQKDDWTVWLVNPDGSETQLSGGGGGGVSSVASGDGTVTVTDGTGPNVDLAVVLGPSIPFVTVQSGAPSTYLTPVVWDSDAAPGGLYVWDGMAYQLVGVGTFFQGWTSDDATTATVLTNSGGFSTAGGDLDTGGGDFTTANGAIDSGGGNISTGGGELQTKGGNIDQGTSV